ncbi:MAG TPA: NADPH-dependent F420 reductase [Glaciihabitans sp.]|jgi:predicted dinucleotide-binding enzyme|nr:NADPH-dependent F420 reductase [Glaciihabitans sp.]
MSTIGFIGSGNIGGQLARLAVAHGHQVVMSNSRGPHTLTELVNELGDAARAGTVTDAATDGDIVVVTVPLAAIATIPVEPLHGKTVIDTNNYYFERDGHITALDDQNTTVSEILQERLPSSHVVKVFNNITAASLTTDGTPSGTANRRALPVAGDDAESKATVSALVDQFGFTPVDAGPLNEGWRYERDTPAYGTVQNEDELIANLAKATRETATS